MTHLLDRFRYCPACGSEAFRESSPRSKRCASCGFEFFLNASAAYAAFVMDQENRLLVVRRSREPARGTLDLPGGFADPDETALEGLAREVMEETGLTIADAQMLFSFPNRYTYSGMSVPTLDLFFLCHVEDVSLLHAADDATDAQWLPLDEVDASLFGLDSIRRGVETFLTQMRSVDRT